MMKHIDLPSQEAADYRRARELATACANQDTEMDAPELVAWHDGPHRMMSPAIAGADVNTRWHDYGASHDGRLEVSVGGYDFIFTDGGAYESYGPSPYVNLSDAEGHEYLCVRQALHDAHTPDADACFPLDDYTSQMT